MARKKLGRELAGIAWWNALTEAARADWLRCAGSATPADAWAEYKRQAAAGTAARKT
jgi:hypothetical protein